MKKSKALVRGIAMCALACSILASFSGCGKKADEPTIAVILKSKNTQYWDVVSKGAFDAGEELGYKIEVDSPNTEAEESVQIDLIEKAIKDKVDAVVVAPISMTNLNESIKKVQDAGITIVAIDSRPDTDVVYIGTDNEAAGGVAGREAKNTVGGDMKYAIVALTEEAPTSVQRTSGFINTYGSEPLEITYCNANEETAKEQAKELIGKYPDLQMIYGVNQHATLGICAAVEELGMEDKIEVIGFDSSEKEIEYVESGVLTGMVVQNPYNMGYLGIRYSDKAIAGEEIPEVIDTGATFVSKENINNDDVQLLLYPLGKEE